jgi:hypothetical protein
VTAQTRQRDPRELQRVEPPSGQAPSDAARRLQHEGAVERRVVRHDVAIADEVRHLCDDLAQPRSAGNEGVVDAGELGGLTRDRLAGIHERGEALQHFRPSRDHHRDLDHVIARGIESGRLHVEERELGGRVVEPEQRAGDRGKRGVAPRDLHVGTGRQKARETRGRADGRAGRRVFRRA